MEVQVEKNRHSFEAKQRYKDKTEALFSRHLIKFVTRILQALHINEVAHKLGLEAGPAKKETDWALCDMLWSLGSQTEDGLETVKYYLKLNNFHICKRKRIFTCFIFLMKMLFRVMCCQRFQQCRNSLQTDAVQF